MKKLLIIDSFALIFRAYYAYPPSLTTATGEPINAAYGFTTIFLDVLKKFQPDYVIAVFDSAKPTIRSTEYALYKAHRKEVDTALISQIPRVAELMETFDVPVLSVDGYEADDIIGTLVEKYKSNKDLEKIIVTGDQDIFQLIDETTSVFLAGKKFSESKPFKAEEVKAKLGITPEQVPDYKALAGDQSDNIPGVNGIGKKTATDLVAKYGSVDEIYKHLDELKKGVAEKLSNDYEMAMKSLDLATIVRKVPLSFDLERAKLDTVDVNKVISIFNELRFKSLISKLDHLKNLVKVQGENTLFDQYLDGNQMDTSKAPEKEFDFKQLENPKTISANYLINNFTIAPTNWEFSELYVCFDSDENVYKVNIEDTKKLFSEIIKKEITLVGENVKNIFHVLLNLGMSQDELSKLKFEDICFATQILSGGILDHTIESAFTYAKLNHVSSTKEKLSKFCEINTKFVENFTKNKGLKNIYELEKSIILLVCLMEQKGIILDKKTVKEYEKILSELKAEIQAEIFKDVGHEFNINSPKQVSDVLYKEKNLAPAGKTKGGALSTNERALSKLKGEPVVDNILRYREVDKLLSTYILTLPKYIDEKDGRIHSIFDQLGAVSGRFSSKNPNLQNIPSEAQVGIDVKMLFHAEEGKQFVAFDYSQQELRILSAMAKEDKMVESFKTGLDIHKVTASELFGKKIEEVTDHERSVGKTLNFSIVYGISSFGLSDRLQMDMKAAQDLINKFYDEYPNIKKYFDNQKLILDKQAYTETALGRRRSATNLSTINRFARQAIERELLNFSIQGTAADLMKEAMQKIAIIVKNYDAFLLLQIHDEFLFEFKGSDSELKRFISEVKEAMESVTDLGVGYKVDAKKGSIWGEMEKIK